MAQVLQMIAALEAKHGDLEHKHNELIDVLLENDRRWSAHGVRRTKSFWPRFVSRAFSRKPRPACRLARPPRGNSGINSLLPIRATGYERVDHLLEPRRLSGRRGGDCDRSA